MKVINFFGAPCVGKSTLAAGLFYRMKKEGYNVELVTEFAKDLIWENSLETLSDHLYLLANQNRRIERLKGKVNYVITDSPLLLVAYYAKLYDTKSDIVVKLARELHYLYDNINCFIKIKHSFNSIGRLLESADAVNAEIGIREQLQGVCFYYVDSVKQVLNIVEEINEKYSRN